MNLQRRIRIASMIFGIHRLRTRFWFLMAHLLKIPTKLVVTMIHSTSQRRVKKINRSTAVFQKRVDSILPELRNLNQLTERRRNRVLAERSALLEESEHLRGQIQAPYSAPGATALMTAVGYFQIKLADIGRKTTSFSRLISRIDCDTFYGELLLWLVVPCVDSEALTGDLSEEYLLQISTKGEAGAKAWYRYQLATTLRDCLWKKFERLAAIGTLIDLVGRRFRK
jgi:hypothetical protein